MTFCKGCCFTFVFEAVECSASAVGYTDYKVTCSCSCHCKCPPYVVDYTVLLLIGCE